jgi:hypothetical protein
MLLSVHNVKYTLYKFKYYFIILCFIISNVDMLKFLTLSLYMFNLYILIFVQTLQYSQNQHGT